MPGQIQNKPRTAGELIQDYISAYRARFVGQTAKQVRETLTREPSGNVLVKKAQLRIVKEKEAAERAATAAEIVNSLKDRHPKIEVEIDKMTGEVKVYTEGKAAVEPAGVSP